jgi:hypothetical protein
MRIRNTRWQQSCNEIDDEAKHSFADGIIRIRAISDRLAEIAHQRRRIDRKTLEWFHFQLREVADILYHETLAPMTIMGIDDRDPLESVLVDTFHETYSDGTPVWTREQSPSVTGDPVPAEFYSREIHQRASGVGGSLPPGCKVIVADPPHLRQLAPKAATEQPRSTVCHINPVGPTHEGVAIAPAEDQDFGALRARLKGHTEHAPGLHGLK